VLRDSSGQIDGKVWNQIESVNQAIEEGDFVKYQGNIELYNRCKQLIVNKIRKASPEDRLNGFNERELIPSTEHDIEEMWLMLRSLIDEHTSKVYIKQLLSNVLERFQQEIKSFPAGVEIHHNYWGGFLEHVLSVLECVLFFGQKYPGLDKDLLVAGAILHDIGKMEELSSPETPSYTVPGQLIGHVVLGFDLLQKEASRIPEFPPRILTLLGHLILSHQGRPEWGAPKLPQIPEALVLHYVDDLDAKMNRFYRVLKQDAGESDFTAFDRFLERSIYKGEREGTEDQLPVASS
jgi:3'-5' exoribonuclease